MDPWRALADGSWTVARDGFRSLLSTDESAEAVEGLSWACWWLDEVEAVFEARERAFRLYRDRGDVEGAARMATWLAADHLDFHDAAPVANGWLARAKALLTETEPGPTHGWLAFHEGYLALGRGATGQALDLASRAIKIGRHHDVSDLEMLGLALEGSARVLVGEVEAGMGRLDEATAIALAGEAEIPISGAWTCCFLVTSCEAVRDYPRAISWCDRIAEFADRYGSAYMLGFCRAHYAAIHAWQGRWSEAEVEFAAAMTAEPGSRPATVAAARAGLADLRRRQGRWDEAERLLEDSMGRAAVTCAARLALDRGDAARALRLADGVLRRLPDHPYIGRADALEIVFHAHVMLGGEDEAASALTQFEDLASAAGTRPMQGAVLRGRGLLEATAENFDRAARFLEDALVCYTRAGGALDAALVRLELATCLAARDETSAAVREATTSLESSEALGATHAIERARRLLEALSSRRPESPEPAVSDPAGSLTPREKQVVCLIADGLGNRKIADRLGISEHTVHRHVTNLLRKLGVHSRAAAAAYAVRAGLCGSIGGGPRGSGQ